MVNLSVENEKFALRLEGMEGAFKFFFPIQQFNQLISTFKKNYML